MSILCELKINRNLKNYFKRKLEGVRLTLERDLYSGAVTGYARYAMAYPDF